MLISMTSGTLILQFLNIGAKMRTPAYLSPSSIAQFYKDPREFYLKYLADNRPPRFPQTQPMSAGSAFDAEVKAYLSKNLFGEVRPGFDLDEIFESQVEEQNREWAKPVGEYLFQCYKMSGALADLMVELDKALEEPRFEFTVEGRIPHESVVEGIPLLGKPDVYYVTREGAHVIHDWKVNGYCSMGNTSPKKGYINCRDSWDSALYKHSRSNRMPHKDAILMIVQSINVNVNHTLEDVDKTWAAQTAIYAWLLGEEVGSKFITGIEQLACNGVKGFPEPFVRVASFRSYISSEFQFELLGKIVHVWQAIANNTVVTEEEAKSLDDLHLAYQDKSPKGKWFESITRKEGF